jgi:hypothetical protein
MSDPPRHPGRSATWWIPGVVVLTTTFGASLALPWAQEEWTQQRVRGWSVLFAGDGYPRSGILLVAAWATAVVAAATRPGRPASAGVAVVAAGAACAICPGWAGWQITRDRGIRFGQDAAGRFTEWPLTSTVEVGYYVATLSTVALLVAVLLRIRQAARANRTTVEREPGRSWRRPGAWQRPG